MLITNKVTVKYRHTGCGWIAHALPRVLNSSAWYVHKWKKKAHKW